MSTSAELLTKMQEIVDKGVDIEEVAKEVAAIQQSMLKAIEPQVNQLLEDFVAAGNEPDTFVVPTLEEENKLEEMISVLKDRKKKKEQEIKNAQEENLKTKQDLIAELRDIISNEENIGKAFNRLNAVQDKWKATGEVSPHAYKDLQNEYSKVLEEFFYHINIYKELKDNDLKRNLQQREEMVLKMKALVDEKNIKNARSLSSTYLSEWDEIGPVNKEDWEKIRDEFRTYTKQVHERIKNHFNEIKEQRKNNLENKQVLLEKVTAIAELEIENLKTWKKKTDEVLAIQKEWKSIGFATKKENDKIWEDFRAACNTFFDKKGTFFGGEKEKWDDNKAKKQKLVDRAEQLAKSTDWKETSFQIIKLQKEWKKIGSAGQKAEQSLWVKFRGACDTFFNAKKEYYDTLDDRLAENLKKERSFLSKLAKAKIEKENGADQIKTLMSEWDELGMVPKSSMKDINEKYRMALDEVYAKLGLDKSHRESKVCR